MNKAKIQEALDIIEEEGKVRSNHLEIAPLFKFHEAILPVLKRYSSKVKESEGEYETTNALY